jgi:hypothetical protein
MLPRVREDLAAWSVAPSHASLFGSAARADGDTQSDIDLLIVRPVGVDDDDQNWRSQLAELTESVHRWTGNHASIVELSEEEFGELRTRRPDILADLHADGIDLAGTPRRGARGARGVNPRQSAAPKAAMNARPERGCATRTPNSGSPSLPRRTAARRRRRPRHPARC